MVKKGQILVNVVFGWPLTLPNCFKMCESFRRILLEQIIYKFSLDWFKLGVIQKLRWQDFGLFWPPTYPWLTFLKEFHAIYVKKCTLRWHFPYYLPTSSCQRSFWMTPIIPYSKKKRKRPKIGAVWAITIATYGNFKGEIFNIRIRKFPWNCTSNRLSAINFWAWIDRLKLR